MSKLADHRASAAAARRRPLTPLRVLPSSGGRSPANIACSSSLSASTRQSGRPLSRGTARRLSRQRSRAEDRKQGPVRGSAFALSAVTWNRKRGCGPAEYGAPRLFRPTAAACRRRRRSQSYSGVPDIDAGREPFGRVVLRFEVSSSSAHLQEMSDSDWKRCSFCGKNQHNVATLIAGPDVFICDECVDVCIEVLASNNKKWCQREIANLQRILSQ